MNRSAIVGNELLLDGQPFFMLGGEMHYFRLPVQDWADRFAQMKDCGLNTVTSYMPWYHHEPVEGQVDLEGATLPERSLRRFLDLAVEHELYVMARPGPFVNSELRCGGIPEWLFRDHPETRSHRADDQWVTGRMAPAEGEPLYRRYVRGWYRAVNALLAEYDVNRGGPVILYQPDNELSAAWTYGLTNSLYDPQIIADTWPRWLQRQYGETRAMCKRYFCKYETWQLAPPRAFPTNVHEKVACLDWLNFKRWFFADWGATLAAWAREDGIEVPITFNEPVAGFYGHGDHAGFGAVLRERGVEGCTTVHTYSPPLLDPEGAAAVIQAVEIAKSSPWGGPPLAVEVNAGWFIPRLDRSGINWAPLLRVGQARGLRGWAVYPVAAGEVSLGDVIDGPDYWPTTCLDREGRCRPGFYELQRFYRFVAAWAPELAATHAAADLTLGYSPTQRLLDFLGWPSLGAAVAGQCGPGGEAFDAEPTLAAGVTGGGEGWRGGVEAVTLQTLPAEAGVWRKYKEAGLTLARLNLAYDMVELTNPNRAPGHGWVVVPCVGTLETAAIDWCLAHLQAGGGLLFAPCLPLRDQDGELDLRLSEALGVSLLDQVRPAGGQLLDYGARALTCPECRDEVAVNGWIWRWHAPEAEVLAQYEGQPVIVQVSAGPGRAIVAGTDLTFTNPTSLEMWRAILTGSMEITSAVRSQGEWCHALLQRGEPGDFLTVINEGGNVGTYRLRVCAPVGDLHLEVDLEPHEARCLALNATLAGRRLLYTTSELIPLDPARRRVELWGKAGTAGELCFAEPLTGRLQGAEVRTEERPPGHVLRYTHTREPLVLELP